MCWVVLRDLMVFQVKLTVDGLKDVVLLPVSILAVSPDLAFPGSQLGQRFHSVMILRERFDRWLSLFSAALRATARGGGLFGVSQSGSSSLLRMLEETLFGRE